MTLPSINMHRVYLVARRDFVGYVKTWGFWVSFFLPFIFGALGYLATTLDINVEPMRYEVVLDETGKHKAGILEVFALQNKITVLPENVVLPEGMASNLPEPRGNTVFIDPPAQSMKNLQPYLKGDKLVSYGGLEVPVAGVLHITQNDDGLGVNYWSSNINYDRVKRAARTYFRNKATENYLATGGLTRDGLRSAQKERVSVDTFDPTKTDTGDKSSQAVRDEDIMPFRIAAVLSAILWLTVFSGSYMLLTSMLEEKLNKLLEMMLASTRFSEIILGKLIGVAALTLTTMAPYLLTGAAFVIWFIFNGDPAVSAGLINTFTPKLIIFFIVFLILGYIFYGAFFIALGALAESMQDAQTLTTPIMLVLTSCILVVPLALNSPESPVLDFAAWFPLSTPFASIARLPSDPPWWELTLSAFFLFIVTMGVIWVAGRIFKYGILSGAGVKSVKEWFGRVIFRRNAS